MAKPYLSLKDTGHRSTIASWNIKDLPIGTLTVEAGGTKNSSWIRCKHSSQEESMLMTTAQMVDLSKIAKGFITIEDSLINIQHETLEGFSIVDGVMFVAS